MHKVLVIGCGGSGARTLSYMLDQLHADLAVHGIDEVPGSSSTSTLLFRRSKAKRLPL